jgi:hypothetical protein
MQGKESSPIRAGEELIPVLAAGNGPGMMAGTIRGAAG